MAVTFRDHKTKIVCTIGPASSAREVLERMIDRGLDVARINFAHGSFEGHQRVIEDIRASAAKVGRRVAILADLPGPKLRIGKLATDRLDLQRGETVTLIAVKDGDAAQQSTLQSPIPVAFPGLAQTVKPGNLLFLNDGYVQLEVLSTKGDEISCRVAVSGELRSHKGLNVPAIDLGISAITEYDQHCIGFAASIGIDALSVSFVQSAADIKKARDIAGKLGYAPLIIAKMERSLALKNAESIVEAADGIMVARGDLGVETPIEEIAVVQKQLIRTAKSRTKPVITATQMLESMVHNRRPTRAEVTDVANAILDGTDCVMLSEESALGSYPVEAVETLARIAAVTEPHRAVFGDKGASGRPVGVESGRVEDLIAHSVDDAVRHLNAVAAFVPTQSGATARRVSGFRLPVWIVAVSRSEQVCQALLFCYGVYTERKPESTLVWSSYARDFFKARGQTSGLVVLTEGPSPHSPHANNRIEIVDLAQ
jgi:pyruvate kinase